MIRKRLKSAIDWRLQALVGRLDSLGARIESIERRLDSVDERIAEVGHALERMSGRADALPEALRDVAAIRAAIDERVHPMLRAILDEESENRRKLYELRDDTAYESAHTEPDPLVSIVIATVGRSELVTRALPSLLAQSHSNIEVLVVGDHAPAETAVAISGIGDPRVRYWNLTQRLVAHGDPQRGWLVGSTMARNEAARQARGRWLVYFDDDDHLRPDAIARLLDVAREQRAEVAYGGFEQHDPSGRVASDSAFPPRWGAFAWPAALVHGGLRYFERELVATHLELPGDMYMLTRMLRAGVRFAMLDDVVLDYFPSSLWGPESGSARPSVLTSLEHHDRVLSDAESSTRTERGELAG
jgi:hypothetical protein